MGRSYVLGGRPGRFQELACEVRVGLKVDSRWTLVSEVDWSTYLMVLAVWESVELNGLEGCVTLEKCLCSWKSRFC